MDLFSKNLPALGHTFDAARLGSFADLQKLSADEITDRAAATIPLPFGINHVEALAPVDALEETRHLSPSGSLLFLNTTEVFAVERPLDEIRPKFPRAIVYSSLGFAKAAAD